LNLIFHRTHEPSEVRSPKVLKVENSSLPGSSQGTSSGLTSSSETKKSNKGADQSNRGPVSRQLRKRRVASVFQDLDRSSSESEPDIATTEPAENPPLGKEVDHHHRAPTNREVEGASAGSSSSRTHHSPNVKSKLSQNIRNSGRKHSSKKSHTNTTAIRTNSSVTSRGEHSKKSHKNKEVSSPVDNIKNTHSSEADSSDSA